MPGIDDPKNPADDKKRCLACIGAPNFPHTCSPQVTTNKTEGMKMVKQEDHCPCPALPPNMILVKREDLEMVKEILLNMIFAISTILYVDDIMARKEEK